MSFDPNITARQALAAQTKQRFELKSHYDFIVCGSGSSGSVVAGRLAANPDVNVLLVEAGGREDVPAVTDASQWLLNIGTERDWSFVGQPNPHLNGRSLLLSMGKVLGGGSSINGLVWVRGHKNDWNYFAEEAGDAAWNYQSVLDTYRRIEDWQGPPDSAHRGSGGPIFVQPAPDPNPIALAMVEGARSVGIPKFENPNGRMMEGDGGASICDLLIRDGGRQSIFRSYVFPYMTRSNLTVLPQALVTRLVLENKRATGVEIFYEGKLWRLSAGLEVILSLGAINTPKVLMLSGIGDRAELQRFGIPLVQHLPGVGQNFQNHPAIGCIWEYQKALAPRNSAAEASFFWKSEAALKSPDIHACHVEIPVTSPEMSARFNPPAASWTLLGSVTGPKSRGRLRLTGSDPFNGILIEENSLSHADDMKAAVACVEISREVGNSAPMRSFSKREIMPGPVKGVALEQFIRTAAGAWWHQACTAKMGRDSMSVVDGSLRVYGIDNLRIADASIMPRIPTGNTMAPCVMIGERAAEMLRAAHNLSADGLETSTFDPKLTELLGNPRA
jgi:choline dehydrogenase